MYPSSLGTFLDLIQAVQSEGPTMPSDHIGLEEKRLQLQPRSPLGKVLAGRTSNQD